MKSKKKSQHILYYFLSILSLLFFNLFAENNNAVIINDISSYEIKSPTKTIYKVYKKIVVKNNGGNDYGAIVIIENDIAKLKKFKGKIFDKNGKKIKKIKKKDLLVSNLSGWSIISPDTWRKVFVHNTSDYPYTIEYEYEMEFNSLFFGLHWYPQSDVNVLSSNFSFTFDKSFKYKIYNKGIEVKPKKLVNGSDSTYQYSMLLVKPRDIEDHMAPEDKSQKFLTVIPEKFVYEGYQGSYESWDTFAQFIRDLNKDRYNLNTTTINFVKKQIGTEVDPKKQIQILYKFLQDRTRYQAISIGIGGIQPHFAQDVFNNCYGDCKDLSILMISMLKAIGIKAYPVLILTRNEGTFIPDMVLSQFNHFICMVPLESDTLWLENTADYSLAGDLSYLDEDCDVFVIKDDGYEIIKTPVSKSSENVFITKFKGQMNGIGSIKFSGEFILKGEYAKVRRAWLIGNPKEEDRREWLLHELGSNVPTTSLNEFSFENVDENLEKPLKVIFSGSFSKCGTVSGNRLFIIPNLFSRYKPSYLPDEDVDKRNYDVYRNYAYTYLDTVFIEYHPAFKVEFLPEKTDLETNFSHFNAEYGCKNLTLNFNRKIEFKNKRILVKNYKDYIDYLKKIIKVDKQKVVLVKQ